MARARSIKPGIFKNELLGTADPIYTLAFVGLWMLADRDGRLEDRPVRIKGEVFPYRDVDVDSCLRWLAAHDFIKRYERGGRKCICICKFGEHQRPHPNEPASRLPAPQGSTNGKPKEHRTDNQSAPKGRSTSRLLIESLFTESPSPIPFTSDRFREALFRWADHRTERHNALTPKSIRAQLAKMREWGEERAIAAIDYSIEKGWIGLFEEGKGHGNQGNRNFRGNRNYAPNVAQQAADAIRERNQ